MCACRAIHESPRNYNHQTRSDTTKNALTYSTFILDLAVPYEVLFVFDALIFSLTVYKTYVMGSRGSVLAMARYPRLIALLLRDGKCRFIVIEGILIIFGTQAQYTSCKILIDNF